METRLLFVHALSPLHAGTGQGVGVIDLPIAREKATNIPYLPGSSLKGVLRDQCANPTTVFGPDTKNASDHAGSAQFSDQRLLLLPMRSLAGTFAWVTAPYILRRFLRDVHDTKISEVPTTIPGPSEEQASVIQEGCALIRTWQTTQQQQQQQQKIVLEDLDLTPVPCATTTAWATWLAPRIFPSETDWQTMLKARLCVVHDDIFSFLLNTATEITTRIKLKEDTKTVEQGGLWTEEALPTETILYGLVMAMPVQKTWQNGVGAHTVFAEVANLTRNKALQFGGNATVGRGLCHVQMLDQPTNGTGQETPQKEGDHANP
jgi:CRISPR-associated protein Cmr4